MKKYTILAAIYKVGHKFLSAEGQITDKDVEIIGAFYEILHDRLTEEDWANLRKLIS